MPTDRGREPTLTLQSVKEQIDRSILQNITLAIRLAALGGVVLYAVLSLLPGQDPIVQSARMHGSLTLTVAAGIAWLISQRGYPRVATVFFATTNVVIAYALAWKSGTGIGSSGTLVPAAVIVVVGFVLGPQAGRWATRLAIAAALTMWAAEWRGYLPGIQMGHAPPAVTYAVVSIIVFQIIGSTIAHFSRLLWDAMHTIEQARQELQSKVDMLEKTQRELLESKRRLTALLDHAPMSVLIFDKDNGRLHYANRFAMLAHGAQAVQDLARDCLYAQAPFSAQDMLQAIHQTRDKGPRELQWRSRQMDGSAINWLMQLNMLIIDDAPYVAAFGHDITEQLRAEQALIDHRAHLEEQVRLRTAELTVERHRLEAVIEALPVSLSIKDMQGRYQLSNRLFEEGSGLSKDMLLGNTADELFPPAMADQIRLHDAMLLAGAPMVRYESSRMRRDGSQRDQLITKVPLMDAQGQPEAILTLSIDITDQKTLQRELAHAKNEAERLATVKSEFLANMSHEIRTPLHGVLGLAQIAQTLPPGDAGIQPILSRITRSGRHLLGVINDILDFSKIDAGKLTIEPCALSPRQLAEDALAMVEERATHKGLRLRLICKPTPPAVIGDALRIRQVLINLLSNGIKFTERGEVTLTLAAEHGQLYFEVQDTGIGIHPLAADRVFSPFEQADGSTSRRFGGTGLGLSISRKLALLMGGDIRLRSTLGQGATFTLVLPLVEVDPASLPRLDQIIAPTPIDVDTPPRLSGLRILTADDVDINRDILHALLTREQAEVHCAEDGLRAIELHKAHGAGYFDLVLMDVQMPVMNGIQATELLHMREADLPIVALTAHAMPDERQRYMEAGMVGHLAKPFEADEVVHLILQHARNKASHTPPSPPATSRTHAEANPASLSPLFDAEAALKRCGGQDGLLRKLVGRFCQEQSDFVARIQKQMAEDSEQATRTVHMFKGTSANLGLPALSAMAGHLESALAAGDTPAIAQQLQALQRALQQHLNAMGHWLGSRETV